MYISRMFCLKEFIDSLNCAIKCLNFYFDFIITLTFICLYAFRSQTQLVLLIKHADKKIKPVSVFLGRGRDYSLYRSLPNIKSNHPKTATYHQTPKRVPYSRVRIKALKQVFRETISINSRRDKCLVHIQRIVILTQTCPIFQYFD